MLYCIVMSYNIIGGLHGRSFSPCVLKQRPNEAMAYVQY